METLSFDHDDDILEYEHLYGYASLPSQINNNG
jgi:hypothetical protein